MYAKKNCVSDFSDFCNFTLAKSTGSVYAGIPFYFRVKDCCWHPFLVSHFSWRFLWTIANHILLYYTILFQAVGSFRSQEKVWKATQRGHGHRCFWMIMKMYFKLGTQCNCARFNVHFNAGVGQSLLVRVWSSSKTMFMQCTSSLLHEARCVNMINGFNAEMVTRITKVPLYILDIIP